MTFLRHSGDRHSGRDPQQEEECPEEARELQGRLCQVLRLTFSRETKILQKLFTLHTLYKL